MTVETKVEGNNIGLINRWSGYVTIDEFLSLLKDVFFGKDFKDYKYWVFDFSGITGTSISPGEIYRIIDLDREGEKINSDVMIVLIATEELYFGLSRMWEILAEDISWETMVLKTKEEANDFLKKRMKEKYNMDVKALT